MKKIEEQKNIEVRPPVIVVMGHIDHGKSTLLDYIRNTNIVDKEAGGITQHISAYEVIHKGKDGQDKKITFLDTPGHEAFSKMRERGARIADIAILVVSAEDSVKPQTIEAWKTIIESKTPYVVAINKIDKPGANIEKTKIDLAENEIYLENYGGNVPFATISAKTGEGIDELLSLISILAEMENFTGDKNKNAEGYIIESNLDPKRGIEASLIIKNGTLKKGMFVATDNSICATRIFEDFKGKTINEATFSAPIKLIGFDKVPNIGVKFESFNSKEEALEYVKIYNSQTNNHGDRKDNQDNNKKIIPVILKADVFGSIEALEKEISKVISESAEFKIIAKGIGNINENDIKNIGNGEDALVVGFNVKADRNAIELAERSGIQIALFEIIYKITDWLKEQMEEKRPKIETEVLLGKAKILKTFSKTKEKQIVGGKVVEGNIILNSMVRIVRREFEIGQGKIVNLEKGKTKSSSVEEGTEFGMMIESKIEIAPGDIIESFNMTKK